MGKDKIAYPRYGIEGNIYIVVEDYEGPVFLLDINGNQVTVSKNRFLTLDDYRATQIEKLL